MYVEDPVRAHRQSDWVDENFLTPPVRSQVWQFAPPNFFLFPLRLLPFFSGLSHIHDFAPAS